MNLNAIANSAANRGPWVGKPASQMCRGVEAGIILSPLSLQVSLGQACSHREDADWRGMSR